MSDRSPRLSPLRVVLLVVAAPWWAIWALWLTIRGTAGAWHTLRALQSALADHRDCPACGGHNTLLGRWQCKCGFVYLGHAFAPCPSCAAAAGWIECSRCGAGIRSPGA